MGENIDDPRWANQTISYAAVAGVEWVALTDGAQWRIYNAHAPVPIEEKLFRKVDVAQDPDGASELLQLLSKENMRENRIQELWQSYFVDRQIHAVLTNLFTGTEPSSDLVNLVAKRTDRLSKDAVRASLVRARATFDFPLPNLVAIPPIAPPGAPRQRQPTSPAPAPRPSNDTERGAQGPPPRADKDARSDKPRKTAVTPEERALKLGDLLHVGRIEHGALTAQYDAQTWNARVHANGSLEVLGEHCASLSKAGERVKRASRGEDLPYSVAATDGWEFWSARDAVVGDTVKLKEIRRRAALGDKG